MAISNVIEKHLNWCFCYNGITKKESKVEINKSHLRKSTVEAIESDEKLIGLVLHLISSDIPFKMDGKSLSVIKPLPCNETEGIKLKKLGFDPNIGMYTYNYK